MPLSEKDKIVKAVDDAYLKNKDRLIKFFSDKGFNKSESANLAHTMKNAVYFLETHEHYRHDIEISKRSYRAVMSNIRIKSRIGTFSSYIYSRSIRRSVISCY